jgi:lipopolysaccharide/colanic/teichoic acid biosynthesis glycosyltransferase
MSKEAKYRLKENFDIVLAVFVIILLSPMILLIAVLIKLESKGPVIYRHERVGKWGKPFKMWKFRTMVQDADQVGPGLTAKNDPRITKFGGFLRRASLDELPQLYNVLRGEMSIVGPRPEIPEIVRTYSLQQQRALAVKPGITGLSQINGRDDLPLDLKLDYEKKYVNTFSLGLDVKILFKTIPVLIHGRGNRC